MTSALSAGVASAAAPVSSIENNVAVGRVLTRVGSGVALLAYFLYLNWSSLTVHLQGDDVMNASYYFRMRPALALAAWRSRNAAFRLCFLLALIAPLPIEFLERRAGAALWAPYFGWTIGFSILFVFAARRFAQAVMRLLSGEPRMQSMVLALVLGPATLCWANVIRQRQTVYVGPKMLECGADTWAAIQGFRSLHPSTPRNSTIVFLHDPFPGWEMAFIAELYFRDRSLNVWLEGKVHHSADSLARATHIYDYQASRGFVLVR